MLKDRRASKRFEVNGVLTTVSDSRFSYRCVISDVSLQGFKIKELPESFDVTTANCSSIINGPQLSLKILVQPCWIKMISNSDYQEVGFKITDPPQHWVDYVTHLVHPNGA